MSVAGVNNEPLYERALFGYDGSLWRPVLVDTSGNLYFKIATGATVTVVQATAANLKALVDINTGQSVTAVQATAANLKALVDINTGQSVQVTQATAANLKALVNINTGQSVQVTQATAASLKALVDINTGQSLTANIANVCANVAAFNDGGTSGATDGNVRDTLTHDFALTATVQAFSSRIICCYNGLNQAVTVSLFISETVAGYYRIAYQASLASANSLTLTPLAGGTGSALTVLPALAGPLGNAAILRIQAAIAPASGTFLAGINGIS